MLKYSCLFSLIKMKFFCVTLVFLTVVTVQAGTFKSGNLGARVKQALVETGIDLRVLNGAAKLPSGQAGRGVHELWTNCGKYISQLAIFLNGKYHDLYIVYIRTYK